MHIQNDHLLDSVINWISVNSKFYPSLFDKFGTVATLSGWLIAAIAYFSLKRAYYSSRFIKLIDMTNEFDKRYELIYAERFELCRRFVGKTVPYADAEAFFVKYWALQSSQFNFFIMGVVDPYVYTIWTIRKLLLFRENKMIPGWSAAQGWVKFGSDANNKNVLFAGFVGDIYLEALQRRHGSDADEEFAGKLISRMYNSKAASKYRGSVTSPGSEWNYRQYRDLCELIEEEVKDMNVTKFPKAEKFSSSVIHEKFNIIGPFLIDELNKFLLKNSRILDYGCGPFHLGIIMQRAHYIVDGYDPDRSMISNARQSYGGELRGRVWSELSEIGDEKKYNVVLLSFVHQIGKDKSFVADLFRKASRYIDKGGFLIIIGVHPKYIGEKFSAFYNNKPKFNMRDGDSYEGFLSNSIDEEPYKIVDHYYKIETIKNIIQKEGLEFLEVKEIPDVPLSSGLGGSGFPYFFLRASKTKD